MADKKANNLAFILIILAFLLVIGGLIIYTKPKLTGMVIGPGGEECDGTWVCGDWGNCTDGNQSRSCESNDSVNCTSPVIEYQECTSCVENWTCSEWSNCTDGNQTRTCEDANECGTEEDKPELIQECTSCVENWTCTNWSECIDDLQNRTCTDSELCGTNSSKPNESQSCTLAFCGDGECNGDEDCDNCSEDCGDCDEDEESESESESESETEVPFTAAAIEEITCTADWQCGAWSECIDNTQSRTCEDANGCGTEEGKPAVSQSCEPLETCFDGIKNQDEKGIDCGGVCEKRCSFFTIVGSVVNTPIQTGKEFFLENKVKSSIILGVLVLGIAGLVTSLVLRKKNIPLSEIFEKIKSSPQQP